MKGKKKFASLFYLRLYLSSSISKDVYKGLNKLVQRNEPLKWRDLLNTLFLHDWFMQEEHSIIDVKEKTIKIKEYFQLNKSIVNGEEGNGLKIPKMRYSTSWSSYESNESTVTKYITNQKSI